MLLTAQMNVYHGIENGQYNTEEAGAKAPAYILGRGTRQAALSYGQRAQTWDQEAFFHMTGNDNIRHGI